MNGNLWAVCANLLIKQENGYELCKQLPAFYLNGDVQGFNTPEGCQRVVNYLLNPLELPYIRILASVAQV
jgi:hypothetical protein